VIQAGEQKAKAFEAALNRHGFALQYAVAQFARELSRFAFSNWFPVVPEFPVRVQGADTRIDLILRHRTRPCSFSWSRPRERTGHWPTGASRSRNSAVLGSCL
jgi:hypothetical protein